VHLVGFIVGIHHDARSSECQILYLWFQILLFMKQMKGIWIKFPSLNSLV